MMPATLAEAAASQVAQAKVDTESQFFTTIFLQPYQTLLSSKARATRILVAVAPTHAHGQIARARHGQDGKTREARAQ
jgi:hypothetical protein